ncbi:MAG: hypothetical protein ACOZCL_07490 [Bacillota bacterium]
MFKKLFVLLLITSLICSSTLIILADSSGPDVYTITVTEDSGSYTFGNIEVTFKKDSLGRSFEPVVFTVSVYAENGTPYIEFTPDVEEFFMDVHIKVKKGTMDFYDTVLGVDFSMVL